MNTESGSLQDVFDQAFDVFSTARQDFTLQLTPREIGTITSVSAGIATISGLPGIGSDELVSFPGNLYGIAFNIDADEIGVVLLGDYWHLRAGDEVRRTGRVMDVPVGDGLLDRVIDPLGFPLDGKEPLITNVLLPIERPATPIINRAPVREPLQTGLKVIDALIPVGRGQRELILGDRQTGKTSIAIDTILNQRDKDVLCVYCAIGQRGFSIVKSIATLRQEKAMDYTIVVVTEGNNPSGLAYIAPYAATSIAEYFMEQGRDVLIVYDDLTHHARAYRELSLLLRRPPGREAFPGDIFYIHSRLLERGLGVCLQTTDTAPLIGTDRNKTKTKSILAVVFGSDQGLVGRFNDIVANHTIKSLADIPGTCEIWTVGDRVHTRLTDAGLSPREHFTVPNYVGAITHLVGQILVQSEERHSLGKMSDLYLFNASSDKSVGDFWNW